MVFLPVNANSFIDPVTRVVCTKFCMQKKFIAKIVRSRIIYRFKTSNLESEGNNSSVDSVSVWNMAIFSCPYIKEHIAELKNNANRCGMISEVENVPYKQIFCA